jgi:hypothetical protein
VKTSSAKASIRSLKNAFIRIESAYDCDGSECLVATPGHEGNPGSLVPHFHLIAWEPDAGFRCYAVAGDLPKEVYEPSH